MYKNFEGSELYCMSCKHTWDVDNLKTIQTCPKCRITPVEDTIIGVKSKSPSKKTLLAISDITADPAIWNTYAELRIIA